MLSARLGDEERLAQEVRDRLGETVKALDAINQNPIAGDQRDIVASIWDFVAKAWAALEARDLLRAKALAGKASTLADELRPGRRPVR